MIYNANHFLSKTEIEFDVKWVNTNGQMENKQIK